MEHSMALEAPRCLHAIARFPVLLNVDVYLGKGLGQPVQLCNLRPSPSSMRIGGA
jgi:hypothetical protein